MSKQPETLFKEKVFKDLKTLKDKVFFFKSNEASVRGIPDVIVCFKGKFLALELKKDLKEERRCKNKKLDLQSYRIDQITRAGGKALFISPKTWSKFFKEFFKGE